MRLQAPVAAEIRPEDVDSVISPGSVERLGGLVWQLGQQVPLAADTQKMSASLRRSRAGHRCRAPRSSAAASALRATHERPDRYRFSSECRNGREPADASSIMSTLQFCGTCHTVDCRPAGRRGQCSCGRRRTVSTRHTYRTRNTGQNIMREPARALPVQWPGWLGWWLARAHRAACRSG